MSTILFPILLYNHQTNPSLSLSLDFLENLSLHLFLLHFPSSGQSFAPIIALPVKSQATTSERDGAH